MLVFMVGPVHVVACDYDDNQQHYKDHSCV